MSSSGGGVIVIGHRAGGTPIEITEDDLKEIISALPDGDLKTKLQALLP